MENNGHKDSEQGFPLEFNSCPNCGGKQFLFEKLFAEERAKGKISDMVKDVGLPLNGAIADPTRPALSFPVVLITMDICLDCGTYFAKKIFKGLGQPQMMQPQPQQAPQPGKGIFHLPKGMPQSGMFGRS